MTSIQVRSASTVHLVPSAPAPGPKWAALVGLLAGTAAAIVGLRVGALASYALPSMILSIVAVLVAISRVGFSGASAVKLGIVDVSFVIYMAVRLSVEYFNASELHHSPYAGVVYDPLMYYLGFCAARQVGFTRENVIAFLRGASLPAIFVALLAIGQVLRIPAITQWILHNVSAAGFGRRVALGWDIRGTSTIGHHTAMGGYFTCIAALICIDLLLSRKLKRRATFPLVVLPFVIVGVITTFTFATIATTLIVIIVTLLMLGLRPIFVFGAVGASALAWTIFGQSLASRVTDQQTATSDQFSWLPSTVGFRAEVWINETIPAIAHRPWTGWGIDVYQSATKDWPVFPTELNWISPESEYMRTLISGGWLSMLAECLLFLAVFVVLARSRKAVGWALGMPALVMFVGLLIISGIHNHFTAPGAPLVFWLVIGIMSSPAFLTPPADSDGQSSGAGGGTVAPVTASKR